MKKFMSFMLALAMVFACLPMYGAAVEDATTVEQTITFDSTSKRTQLTSDIQVWEENGITVTNNKGTGSNIADYAAPARFYANSSLLIECGGKQISKIVFNANAAKYATAVKDSITNDANCTVTASSKVATVTFAAPVTSFSIAKLGGQARVDSIVVTVIESSGSEGGSEDDTSAEVSFDLNYEGATGAPETVTLEVGSAYGDLPTDVSREGCTFVGWFTNAGCTGEVVTPETVVEKSHTLYAGWNTTVSFDLNYEGATDAPESMTVMIGKAYGDLPDVSRNDISFIGWFADAEGTGEAVKESDIVKGPQTLYAKWFEVVESEVGDTTIDFSSTTHRVSWDANSQVWTNGGITLTNTKVSDSNVIIDASNPARFYKNSLMAIVCNGNYMSKLVFTANDSGYATALGNSIAEDGNYTVAVDGKLVTVTFNKTVESFDFALSGGQVRMDKMVVTVVDSAEEEPPVVVEEWGMTLEDEIIVNFTMTLSTAIKNDADAYVEVSVGGETYNVPAAQVGDTFKVPVNATQMNDTISLCVVDGNGARTEAGSATIRQYCDAILADPDQAAYHTLVKEMLNYGSAAQLHFGHNTDNLAGQGIEDAGKEDVPAEGGEIGLEDKIEEVDCIGASLVYRDKIAVRYYFEGDLTGCTFAVNGTPSDLQVNGNYVEVADIVPQDLDKQVILTVTDAQGNAITVTYCPMSYIIRMSQKGSDTTKALVKALYNYHLAAKDFSGS